MKLITVWPSSWGDDVYDVEWTSSPGRPGFLVKGHHTIAARDLKLAISLATIQAQAWHWRHRLRDPQDTRALVDLDQALERNEVLQLAADLARDAVRMDSSWLEVVDMGRSPPK